MEKISLGNYVFLGENSKIWSSASLRIGNNVLISHNVNIHDNDSHPVNLEMRRTQLEIILTKGLPNHNYGTKEIIIEDDVRIGFNATILKGVKIGKGSIIGASSVVTKDIPANSIGVGSAAKIIKQ